MITCKKCSVEKPESEMKLRAGAPSKVCIACDEAAKGERQAERDRIQKLVDDAKAEQRAGRGKRKKKAKTSRAAPRRREPAGTDELVLPAGGFGCNARITDEGYLQLTQENDGAKADNICLTRREAKAIFEKFEGWANE